MTVGQCWLTVGRCWLPANTIFQLFNDDYAIFGHQPQNKSVCGAKSLWAIHELRFLFRHTPWFKLWIAKAWFSENRSFASRSEDSLFAWSFLYPGRAEVNVAGEWRVFLASQAVAWVVFVHPPCDQSNNHHGMRRSRVVYLCFSPVALDKWRNNERGFSFQKISVFWGSKLCPEATRAISEAQGPLVCTWPPELMESASQHVFICLLVRYSLLVLNVLEVMSWFVQC